MNKVKGSVMGLGHQLDQYSQTEDTLKSMHHVLSEATLSLLEEHEDGANQFQIRELYWKVNTVQQLLFNTLIEIKKENEYTADYIDVLEREFLSAEDYE